MSYGRATGLSTTGSMSIRRKAKMSLVKMAIKIAILCAFMFWLMPSYIAPHYLGIAGPAYEDYRFIRGTSWSLARSRKNESMDNGGQYKNVAIIAG